MYTSNTIQNKIVDILADQVKGKIVRKVKAARWFTVISDDVTDVSNTEQVTIVLCYVNMESLVIRKDLVELVECSTGITGQSLANNIMRSLEQLGLDLWSGI